MLYLLVGLYVYDRYYNLRNLILVELVDRMPIEQLSIKEPIFNLNK